MRTRLHGEPVIPGNSGGVPGCIETPEVFHSPGVCANLDQNPFDYKCDVKEGRINLREMHFFDKVQLVRLIIEADLDPGPAVNYFKQIFAATGKDDITKMFRKTFGKGVDPEKGFEIVKAHSLRDDNDPPGWENYPSTKNNIGLAAEWEFISQECMPIVYDKCWTNSDQDYDIMIRVPPTKADAVQIGSGGCDKNKDCKSDLGKPCNDDTGGVGARPYCNRNGQNTCECMRAMLPNEVCEEWDADDMGEMGGGEKAGSSEDYEKKRQQAIS